MNITYTQNGDYLIPNIVIRKTKPLGHYGRLRKAYLEMHRPILFNEQFYRNFGLYEKSPNSFLPGLPRSIINQFRFHNLLCLCLASVHLPHPFHLVFSFQLLGHAVLLCQ